MAAPRAADVSPPLGDVRLYNIFKTYATFVSELADFALEQGAFLRCIAAERLLDSGGLAFDEAVLLFNLHAVGRDSPCVTFKRFVRVLQLVRARHPPGGKPALPDLARRTGGLTNAATLPARPSTAHPIRRTPDPAKSTPSTTSANPPLTSAKSLSALDGRPATAPSFPLSGSVTARNLQAESVFESVPNGWNAIREARQRKRVGGPWVCRPEDMPVLLPRELPIPEEAPRGVPTLLERCGRQCAEGRYGEARKSLRKAKQRWADHISELEASATEGQAQRINENDSDSDEPRSKRSGSKTDGAKSNHQQKKSESDSSDYAASKVTKGFDSDDEASASEDTRALEAAAERAARAREESLDASTCVSTWACHVALCEGDLIAAEAALLLAVESEEERTRARAESVARTATGSAEAGRDVRVTVVGFESSSETINAAEIILLVTQNEITPALQSGSPVDPQTGPPVQPQTGEVTSDPVDSTEANGAPVSVNQALSEKVPEEKAAKDQKRFPRSPFLLDLMGTLSFHKMEYRDARECFVHSARGDCEALLTSLGCGGGPEPVASEWNQAPPAKPKSALGKCTSKKALGKSPSKKAVKKEKKLERGPGAYSFRAFGIASPRNEPSEMGGSVGAETVAPRRAASSQMRENPSGNDDVGGVAKEVSVLNNVGACYHVLRDRKKALACYEKALALLADSDDAPGRAVVQRNRARAGHVSSSRKPAWFHVASSLESPPPTPQSAGQPDYGLDSVRAAAAGALGKGIVKTLGLRGALRDQLGADTKAGKGFDWTKIPPDEKDKKTRGAKGAKGAKKSKK
ncbi:hypothetical protein KFL_005720070 [Klebsormidium nitens]|uniref:Uncharacterized protein n=1 Tax=Klebsormidium nitens TaxID=105231 RepID=A0A1Y1IMQ0_KLENI|nr:hypothetical protein KFL_005720070 [Klebsormidium nitens]|eukprot:GAQ89877.1 hypothetical protein KFL_005720070 [Klebsormidium nitens]